MPNNVMNKPYQRAELVRRRVAGEMNVSAMEKSVAAKACRTGEQPDEIDELLVFRGSLRALIQTQEGVEGPGTSLHHCSSECGYPSRPKATGEIPSCVEVTEVPGSSVPDEGKTPVRYRPVLRQSTSERPSTRFIAPFGGIATRFGDDRDDSSSGFSIRCGRRWPTSNPDGPLRIGAAQTSSPPGRRMR
jgi:hypothetical protein